MTADKYTSAEPRGRPNAPRRVRRTKVGMGAQGPIIPGHRPTPGATLAARVGMACDLRHRR